MIECKFTFGSTILTGPSVPVEHVPSGWIAVLEGGMNIVDKAKHPWQAKSALGAFNVVGISFGVGDDGFVLEEKTDGSSPIDDS